VPGGDEATSGKVQSRENKKNRIFVYFLQMIYNYAHMKLLFDEVGYWSEIKLEILEKYAKAYSEIMNTRFYHIYVDAFAGAGKHKSRTSGDMIKGSPSRALDIKPEFKEYYFIDIVKEKIFELEKIAANRPEVHVLEGNCNTILLTDVFPNIKYENYRRGLVLLDPYGLHLDWNVIEKAGTMRSMDMFLNFPVSDMNRNVFWRNSEHVDPKDIKRMDDFWGDHSWKNVAYSNKMNLFGWDMKTDNDTVAQAFKIRLKQKAGFKNVSEPLPMRNSKGATIYYLFFASKAQVAQNIADDIIAGIFRKYKDKGI
jgi:three-Cys-motif partner protein